MTQSIFSFKKWKRENFSSLKDIQNRILKMNLFSESIDLREFFSFGKDNRQKVDALMSIAKTKQDGTEINDDYMIECCCRFNRPLIIYTDAEDCAIYPEPDGSFSFSSRKIRHDFYPDEELNVDLNVLFQDCLDQTIKSVEYDTDAVWKWFSRERRLKSIRFILENGLQLQITQNESGFFYVKCLNADKTIRKIPFKKCRQGFLSWRKAHGKQIVDSFKDEIKNYIEENYSLIFYQSDDVDAEDDLLPFMNELDDAVQKTGQTFSQKLLELIAVKNMNEIDCYKKASIDRKLFSKIRNNDRYRPSKDTVILFALALKLNLDETSDLLQRAGLSFSESSKADLIVQFFIGKGIHDIILINEALYQFDEPVIGNFG